MTANISHQNYVSINEKFNMQMVGEGNKIKAEDNQLLRRAQDELERRVKANRGKKSTADVGLPRQKSTGRLGGSGVRGLLSKRIMNMEKKNEYYITSNSRI